MMKRIVIGTAVVVAAIAVAAIAWAAISGSVNVPAADTGSATSPGGSSCQSGVLTFTWPDPTWNNTEGTYTVSTLDYSGVSAACVSLGTADLLVNVVENGQTASTASASATDMSNAGGTLTLSQVVPFSVAETSTIQFLVKDN